MAAWRKEEVDAARHRPGKERGSETGKDVIAHGSVEPAKRHHLVYSRRAEGILVRTRDGPRRA